MLSESSPSHAGDTEVKGQKIQCKQVVLYIPISTSISIGTYLSLYEWEPGVGSSHGRLPKGGEHGTDGEEEEGTRAWMEALKWDRDAQAGDGAQFLHVSEPGREKEIIKGMIGGNEQNSSEAHSTRWKGDQGHR